MPSKLTSKTWDLEADSIYYGEPGSSVFIVTGYGLDEHGSIPDRGEDFSSNLRAQPGFGPTQPPVQ